MSVPKLGRHWETGTNIVYATGAVDLGGLTVADKAVWPHPFDVFYSGTGLLEHDVTQAGVVGRSRAIGDGEVTARVIAVKENGNVVDLARTVLRVRRQWHPAVR